MKTIKQIADEIGVTKDSLKKRLNREPIKNDIVPYVETLNGIKYITEKGCEIIKIAYNVTGDTSVLSPVTSGDNPTLSPSENGDDPALSGDSGGDDPTSSGDNKKLIEMLQIQLDRKDRQIDKLNARLEDTTSALVAAQQTATTAQALHAGTLQQQLIGSVTANESTDETQSLYDNSVYGDEIFNFMNYIKKISRKSKTPYELTLLLKFQQVILDFLTENPEYKNLKSGFFGLFRRKS
ncbi:MAG: hypothetical protein LBC86_03360 [Oscillospiraceae bacterium]|jgi:hypothetical protein|nr:hypothetical protein [Oscillospiraceae bacterium]